MRALVLSGGGPLAVAWESGLVAGLALAGLRLADADFVLGTSAGAIVGAQLALGIEPARLVDALLSEGEGSLPPAGGAVVAQAFARLPSLFAKAQGAAGDAAAARAEVGAYALGAATKDEEACAERIAGAIGGRAWPEKPFGCVAVDAEDGSIALLSRDCGAGLDRAVAASCSLPGLSPPMTINGRRYIDGGFASSANADLARGYGTVLVIAFQPPGAPGERMAALLEGQLRTLRDAGASTLSVAPDATSQAAIGFQGVDFARRPQIARAAMAQGRAQAGMVAEFWS